MQGLTYSHLEAQCPLARLVDTMLSFMPTNLSFKMFLWESFGVLSPRPTESEAVSME